MSALQGNGEEVERERKRESEMERGCGGEDGRAEGRQPVAPDHNNPPPYSNSEPVLWMGGAELNEAAAEAERSLLFFLLPFSPCASFPAPPVKPTAAEELTQEHSEYFYFTLFTHTHILFYPHF